MLLKLAMFLYGPLLVLTSMTICNAKIGTTCPFYLAWNWKTRSLTWHGTIGHRLGSLAGDLNLTWAEVGGSGRPMTWLLNYRAPIRLRMTLFPPSEFRNTEVKAYASDVVIATKYHESGSVAVPNSRLHNPELRSYAGLIYKQQVILL